MAFGTYRFNGRKAYVYYHDGNTGRLAQLPRKLTRHLDGKPKSALDAWVVNWEAKHGISKNRSTRIQLHDGDKLHEFWSKYQRHRFDLKKRNQNTAKEETEIFERYAVPFFLGKHAEKNPLRWHHLVPGFHDYLRDLELKDATRRKALWILERFGQYLAFYYRSAPFVVQTPATENQKITPLKELRTPEQVLTFFEKRTFKGQTKADLSLLGLLGYFAALRPSESVALDREDILTGSFAETASKTLEGFKLEEMGTRLAVNIYKTVDDKAGAVPREITKTETSRAVVTVWHPGAAKAIAERLKEKPNGRLFPQSYSGIMQAWRRCVQPSLGITLHDLRRSSALYLGRKKRIPLTLLQEHMRHAEIETTMLYIRQPAETKKMPKKIIQDFDDVL